MKYKLIYFSIGDWGANPSQDNCAKYVSNTMSYYYPYLSPSPNFTVSLGDNFYDKGVSDIHDNIWDTNWFSVFIRPFYSLQNMRWFSILGNHDYYGGMASVDAQVEMTKYSKNWEMPDKDFYSYDEESSSYHIFIDTIKIYPELYDETRKLYNEADVEDSLINLENKLIHAKKLKVQWIFVYGHYQLFSNGYYGNYNVMIQRLLPLLRKYKVSVYFSGHEHNFQFLKYDNIYFCVNGAGAFKSQVHYYNSNIEVNTIYRNNNNGFLIHKLNDKYLNLQFVNINNVVEFDYLIPHPGLEPGPPR